MIETIDILDVLTNISNEEVFTPPKAVNWMLDMLPVEYWQDADILWCDPVAKTGVFLREIYVRLMKGLVSKIPNEDERHNYILGYMLCGYGTSDIGARTARRTLYGFQTDDKGNTIVGVPPREGMIWSKSFREDNKMLQYVTEKRKKAALAAPKRTIFVGNPPYQEKDGGYGVSARPLYHLFVEKALETGDEVLFVIPARWYAGGKGLDTFRKEALTSKKLVALRDFQNAGDVFPAVDIAGGVCFAHWKRDHNGSCAYTDTHGIKSTRNLEDYDIFIRDTRSLSILEKVLKKSKRFMEDVVSSRKPFGLPTNFLDFSSKSQGTIPCLTKDGIKYIKLEKVTQNIDSMDKWKVVCTAATPASNHPDADGRRKILAKVEILPPGTICLETYLVVKTSDNEEEARNLKNYMLTKFFRACMNFRLISHHISRDIFRWVPYLDYTKSYTDDDLYKLYDLTREEVEHIESTIR